MARKMCYISHPRPHLKYIRDWILRWTRNSASDVSPTLFLILQGWKMRNLASIFEPVDCNALRFGNEASYLNLISTLNDWELRASHWLISVLNLMYVALPQLWVLMSTKLFPLTNGRSNSLNCKWVVHALPDCVEIWCNMGNPRSLNCKNKLPVKFKMADGLNYSAFNSLQLCRELFDFPHIWYKTWTHDVLQTFKIKGSKVKVTAWRNVSAVKTL